MNWKFWQPKPRELSLETRACYRAEEELQKRQPPAECSWASWETIPGFKEADEAYRAELNRMNAESVAAEGSTSTQTRVRAWYTPMCSPP